MKTKPRPTWKSAARVYRRVVGCDELRALVQTHDRIGLVSWRQVLKPPTKSERLRILEAEIQKFESWQRSMSVRFPDDMQKTG